MIGSCYSTDYIHYLFPSNRLLPKSQELSSRSICIKAKIIPLNDWLTYSLIHHSFSKTTEQITTKLGLPLRSYTLNKIDFINLSQVTDS